MKYLYSSLIKITVVTAVISLGVLFASTGQVSAQATGISSNFELDGYAWSENIGWISLNCKTGGVAGNNICATSNYSLVIGTTGIISGFGWSSNIGWIKFGGLNSYPTAVDNSGVGGDSTNNPARVVGNFPNFTMFGWARACAGTLSGDCSSMVSRADGWDGWIALKGTGHAVSMNASGMVGDSYAWGSTVVGWIDMFSRVSVLLPPQISGTGCAIAVNSASCTGQLSWSMNSSVANPRVFNSNTSQVFDNSMGGVNQPVVLSYGVNNFELRNLTTPLGASVALNATCADSTNNEYKDGICTAKIVTPVVSLTVSPSLVRKGGATNISWDISPPQAIGCVLSGPNVTSPNDVITGLEPIKTRSFAVNNTSIFTATCTGAYGTVTKAVRVDVVPTAQEV